MRLETRVKRAEAKLATLKPSAEALAIALDLMREAKAVAKDVESKISKHEEAIDEVYKYGRKGVSRDELICRMAKDGIPDRQMARWLWLSPGMVGQIRRKKCGGNDE